jgi:hypothetical protein
MEKQIVAISGVDETESLFRQLLDSAFCHSIVPADAV